MVTQGWPSMAQCCLVVSQLHVELLGYWTKMADWETSSFAVKA
ncbi:hypothetical protein AB205_0078840 [Aquarana catesbeiana]|uniref:Uncharacterized protein n=1 Tax=Aquarana catesbeiana TaxID=8400 RepID=A0A2G9SIC0_AQUCT|nr:hypothetical protein AB205_0078840 [Aquarana catesbeiana]